MPITFTKEKYADVVVENNGVRFKLEIRRGNCFGVVIWLTKNDSGEKIAQLYSFFHDEQQLRKIIKHKNTLFYGNVISVKLNMSYKESYKLLPFLVDSGYKVTCYKK